MKYIISMFFIVGLFTNTLANELTQEKIKSFLLESDRFVLSKNVNKIGELLDENVDIIINVDFNGNKQKTKLTKGEYLVKTKEGFDSTQNYSYKILDRKISIKDNIAYVSEQAQEKYTYNNEMITGSSKVNNQIKLINNKLKFVKIEVVLNNIQIDKLK
ncbi:hypothetical protein [Arcobacter sp. s6]|uniref:hypothetical protein n=1 Tax=Arcobacter sp. s6 TaxID=3230363 RepID=UPI0034A04D7E